MLGGTSESSSFTSARSDQRNEYKLNARHEKNHAMLCDCICHCSCDEVKLTRRHTHRFDYEKTCNVNTEHTTSEPLTIGQNVTVFILSCVFVFVWTLVVYVITLALSMVCFCTCVSVLHFSTMCFHSSASAPKCLHFKVQVYGIAMRHTNTCGALVDRIRDWIGILNANRRQLVFRNGLRGMLVCITSALRWDSRT